MEKFAFRRGWLQLRQCDIPVVKKKLMKALNINNRVSFSERKLGKIEPSISEHNAVEQVFAEFGITDVWGKELETVTMAVD